VVSVPPEASLRKVDLSLELQILSFYRQRDAAGLGLAGFEALEPVDGPKAATA
jgi:hypothetical protein